jgi:GNAT superfamily N-acetyltransferase
VLTIRLATRSDVPAILELLADDEVSRARDGTVSEAVDARHWEAFDAIDADRRNELIVAEQDGSVVGTFQLTFTPSLSRGGSERMTIEAVRVRGDLRGQGVGRRMMAWALDRGRRRGCRLAQLTTDKRRADAHRFYESLGFAATHEGMKLAL